MLIVIREFFSPLEKDEKPALYYRLSRLVVALTIFAVSIAYDKTVPEVSTEPRWMILHFTALLLTTLFCLMHIGGDFQFRFKQPLTVWAVLVIALASLYSLTDTYDVNSSWWSIKNVFASLTLFCFTVLLRSKRWYQSLGWLLILAMAINSAIGILQYHGVDDTQIHTVFPFWKFSGYGIDSLAQAAPPAATFVNKNLAASYLVLLLPLALGLFLTTKGRTKQFCSITCFTLGSILLIYTRTRASWLSALLSMLFFGVWLLFHRQFRANLAKRFSPIRKIFLGSSFLVIIFAGGMPSALSEHNSVSERIMSITDLGQASFGMRWIYYRNAIEMAADNTVNGVGVGAFRAAYPVYHQAAIPTPRIAYDINKRWDRLHNDLLQAYVELGLIGGTAYLVLFFGLVYVFWKLATKQPYGDINILSLCLMMGTVALSFNSMMSFPLQVSTAGLAFIMAGMLTGLYKLEFETGKKHGKDVFSIPSLTMIPASICCLALLMLITQDNIRRRTSNYYLKDAWIHSRRGISDDYSLALIEEAYKLYPNNSMLQEVRVLLYTSYRGSERISTHRLIQVLEEAVRNDPYSPYSLTVLGKLYVHQGIANLETDRKLEVEAYAEKASIVAKKLERVAGFRAEAKAIKGYVSLFRNDLHRALVFFEKAALINANDKFVRYGLDLIARRSRATIDNR